MNECTKNLYERWSKQFRDSSALPSEDLELYDRIVSSFNSSEGASWERESDLGALTAQGRHYILTGEVKYLINGRLLSEKNIVLKIRGVLRNGNGSVSDDDRRTLIMMLKIVERHDPLLRRDTKRIEKILSR